MINAHGRLGRLHATVRRAERAGSVDIARRFVAKRGGLVQPATKRKSAGQSASRVPDAWRNNAGPVIAVS